MHHENKKIFFIEEEVRDSYILKLWTAGLGQEIEGRK